MRITTTLLAVSAMATPTFAQDLPQICRDVANVTVGQFAEYRVNVPQMGGPVDMRLAIVGTEDVDGVTHQWHEMKMLMPQGEMIMQMLVPSFPYGPEDINKLVMKGPGQPAMELSPSMMAMMQQQGGANFASDILQSCKSAEKMGDEAVTVPAGSFNTEHYRVSDPEPAEAWISTDVPFGIVKMIGPEGVSMELTGHGMDATSSITETPQRMPGGRP
jgi:hypothetical protein